MSEENQAAPAVEEKKAYDVNVLLESLKSKGLEVAEESVKVLIEVVVDWLDESATLSTTPYDDMAKILYPQLKAMALEKAEDINKEDNA